ncbi:hypothetical protein GS643_19555 [Xanthomonas hortorum pv. gardneri]|uniref:Uncharacterized protein n=1 Tax=Xanthomonas hortorum pv. gardneri TaxID=2754056 RepID=A0A6V7CUF4_9XANT|nr:hypothetical protein [Xanthomonas hortorum]EGD19095.1 hypothetical protein XGA_2189 [Xanthomonas hortorum ATCC 19865]MCC4626213.1 hypothetical protein [Xanthomonas campestris pv. nigromaculans]APP81163.1 hypothetical protein BJD10_16965 [Xanthomonas hortorum pv. gardneri]KLA97658.1 hypothetical protein SM19410_09835 [Xanthomonas hortorum pv. gardneri]KLB21803.1 hypothetical protein SM40611_11340 [Xanthomonas hortorum pv. gardneri]
MEKSLNNSENLDRLEKFVAYWRESLENAVERRDYFAKASERGFTIKDESGNDIIEERVKDEDVAVRSYQRGLVVAESALLRAQQGGTTFD